MNFPFLKSPTTGLPDIWTSLSVLAVLTAVLRFIFEGAVFHFGATVLTVHTDYAAYAAFLSPVLAAHSWVTNNTTNAGGSK